MQIGILNERDDPRVAIIPDFVKNLVQEQNEVWVEENAGAGAFHYDSIYEEAGAKIRSRDEILTNAAVIISINMPEEEDIQKVKENTIFISQFQPYWDTAIIEKLAERKASAFSMDMIPRITRAQAMDVLSSMASIDGYKAVIEAADHLPKYFPMLTTSAGSIPPAKVLVLGAGVAGLQAIATAKRLGAKIEASDTRIAAKEEVESLGAKFLLVEGAKDDKSAGGYAVEQTEDFKKRQAELVAERIKQSDVVITTAQLRGKKAPVLVTKDMIDHMKGGSVIVDIASSTGGNCELTQDNQTVVHEGVTIIGNSRLSATLPVHASQMYSKNMQNFMKLWLKDGQVQLDWEDEIIKSSCVLYQGEILYNKN